MMAYLLFFCVYVYQSYWSHFGLNILFNFGYYYYFGLLLTIVANQ